ncbi:MAG: type II secretion system protein [Candidatus Pacebacteria bacterium]|nr:type II secretion system protein [Candidatus Paceibacterota bacterium]
MKQLNFTNFKNQRGFTMIELLIVIVILAILVVIGIGSFMSSQLKSRDSARKTDLQNIARALELYYNDKGEYPVDTSKTGILSQEWGTAFVDPDNNQTLYMNLLPSDPGAYTYYYTSVTGDEFQLYTYLENENDRDLNKDGDNIQVYTGTDCGVNGIQTCNYGISSSNTDPASGHSLTVE